MDDPRKLLFLDIDGVLNSFAFYKSDFYQKEKEMHGSKVKQYDLKKLDLLKEIYDKTNCTIVMSSSWRSFYFDSNSKHRMDYGCMILKKDLKERGIEINYCTGNEYHKKWYAIYNGYKWLKIKMELTTANMWNLKIVKNLLK